MNALDSINLTIEFVKQQVDPGGGGVVNPGAQTGDVIIWLLPVLFFICLIAFALFRISRIYNNRDIVANTNHCVNYSVTKSLTLEKILLAFATIGLIASVSITTSSAIALTQNNNLDIIPDKIQVMINEETGEATCNQFEFINTSEKFYLFKSSELVLSDDAKLISTAEDWDLTLNAVDLNSNLFDGNPGIYQIPFEKIQVFNPGETSYATLKFNKIDLSIAKQLIGKQAFSLTLIPYEGVIKVPSAVEGLVYDSTSKKGVLEGEGYTLVNNTATEAGLHTATATLIDDYIWTDKSKGQKNIEWFIDKANIDINITGSIKTVTYDKNTTYTFPDYSGSEVAYTATSESEFFNISKILPGPQLIDAITQQNAGTFTLGLDSDKYTFQYNDNNINVVNWNITDGYLKIERKQIAVPKPEENLIYTSKEITGVNGGEGYTLKDDFTGINVGNYQATAQLDSNYVWAGGSVEDKHINWTIQQAKIKSISIMGHNKSFSYDGNQHTFPNYSEGDTSYNVYAFEMEEGHPESAFNSDKIYPPNNTIDIIPQTQTEVGTYPLGLNTISWTLNDSNIDSSSCSWNITDGALQINEQTLVSMTVTGPTGPVAIGSEVTFNIKLKNNRATELSGGCLYVYYNVVQNNISFSSLEEKSFEWKHVIDVNDFIYSKMYEVWSFEITSMEPPFIIYDITETQLAYTKIDVPVIADITYDTKEHKPFDGYTDPKFEIIGGLVAGTDAKTYYTLVAPKPGYCWNDDTHDGKLIIWDIVPLNVKLEFNVGEQGYSVQYGDSWPAKSEDVQIITKQTLPEGLTLGEIFPEGLNYSCPYSPGDIAGKTLNVTIDDSYHSTNFTVSKTNTKLNVVKRVLTISWVESSLKVKYDGSPHWPLYNVEGIFEEESPEIILSVIDSETSPIEVGTYNITSRLRQDAQGRNYDLVGTTEHPTTCILEIEAITEPFPKAVLTNSTFTDPVTLHFLYDTNAYPVDGYILASYNITKTFYSPESNSNIYPEWYKRCNPEKIIINEEFKNCTITSTGENLTNLDLWFAGMTNVSSIEGLENINDAAKQTLNGTFMDFGSSYNNILDIHKLDTNNVSSFVSMFENSNLKSIIFKPDVILSEANTTNMFKNCSNLSECPNMILKSVKNAKSMYENCTSLTNININGWTIAGFSACDISYLFSGCTNLKKIICENDVIDWSSMSGNSYHMFYNCVKLPNYNVVASIPETTFDATFAKVAKTKQDAALFWFPSSEDKAYAAIKSDPDFGNVLFFYTSEDDITFSNPYEVPVNAQVATDIPWGNDDYSYVSSTQNFNAWCVNLTSLNYWFYKSNLKEFVDMKLNTANVKTTVSMFRSSDKIEVIDMGVFDTRNVEDASYMFANCTIKTPNFTLFNTSNIKYMNFMFNAAALGSYDFSNFDTHNVIEMKSMFYGCAATSLDISTFDTKNVKTMESMFASCAVLTEINLSNLSIDSLEKTHYMFASSYLLQHIYCASTDDWSKSMILQDSKGMFTLNYFLPHFSELGDTQYDKTYARADLSSSGGQIGLFTPITP